MKKKTEGWRAQGIVRVDLGVIGLHGLWVDVLRPDFLTLSELEKAGFNPDATSPEEAIESAGTWSLLAICIRDWTIPHPDKDEPLPLPQEAPNILREMLPAGFIRAIVDKLRDIGAMPASESPFESLTPRQT